MFSARLSAESSPYAPRQWQQSVDQVFLVIMQRGEIQARRRMTQCTFQGNEADAQIRVSTCK